MDGCCLYKLSNLFDTFDASELIVHLNIKGVLAGGSIVYMFNNFVPKKSVGDIDVFVNSKETFIELLHHIKDKYPVENFYKIDNYVDNLDDKTPLISIVNVSFSNESVLVQLILQDYQNPTDVIESFDLDYVQCAVHCKTIYKTEICKRAHKSKTVHCGTEFPPKIKRLEKASNKGFNVPLLGTDTDVNISSTNIDIPDINTLTYFTLRDKTCHIVYFDKITANKFVVTDKHLKKQFFDSLYRGKVKIGSGNLVCLVNYLAIEIDINEFGSIKPFYVGNNIITVTNKTGEIISPGKYIALVKFYSVGGGIKMLIHKLCNNNIIPIKFADNFKFDIPNLTTCPNSSTPISSDNVILQYIDKHSDISDKTTDRESKLSWYKAGAYKAFLYYKNEEGKGKAKAIREACFQMSIDTGKINGDSQGCLFLTLIAPTYKSVDEMIHFIEGFN